MEKTCKPSSCAEKGNDSMSVIDSCKCSLEIYPFFDGKLEDFEPVFSKLIEVGPLL